MSALGLVRDEIRAMRGYSSARLESAVRAGAVMLNANESPTAPDGLAHGLHRYPEPQPAALRRRLAALYGVPGDSLLLTRGSDEAIDLLTRAFCRAGRDAVIVSPPTFGMYSVCAEVQGALVVTVPLDRETFEWRADAVRAAVDPAVRLVHVCSPNNPTGGLVPRDAVLALARDLAGRALVVVDEAYVEFADVESLAAEAARGELAVLRTLSKAHALAGARVGALVAEPALVAVLQRIMAPYPIAAPSIATAETALEPPALAATRARIGAIVAERERVAEQLGLMPCVARVLPSSANFLAVRFLDAPRVLQALAARRIVVRDISGQPSLAGFLRISIGARAENDALLAALDLLEVSR